MKRIIIAALVLVAWGPVWGGVSDRMWFGGGVGLSFGDVDYVAIEPVLGFKATSRLSAGVGLIFRYRDDDRVSPSLSSTDYGGNIFLRHTIRRPLFVQVEYERLSYEFRRFDGTTDRDDFESILAGPGVSMPVGGRTSVYALAMYNFDHDDARSPYEDAWIARVGVGIGF